MEPSQECTGVDPVSWTVDPLSTIAVEIADHDGTGIIACRLGGLLFKAKLNFRNGSARSADKHHGVNEDAHEPPTFCPPEGPEATKTATGHNYTQLAPGPQRTIAAMMHNCGNS